MARRKATWRQAELRLSYGSEMWVMVRHRRGTFRMPITGSVETLLWGIAHGWTIQNETREAKHRDPMRPDARVLARVWEGLGEDTPEGPSGP